MYRSLFKCIFLLFFLLWGRITPVPEREAAYLGPDRGRRLGLVCPTLGTLGKQEGGREDSNIYVLLSGLFSFLNFVQVMYVYYLRRQLDPCGIMYFSFPELLFVFSSANNCVLFLLVCLSMYLPLIRLQSLCRLPVSLLRVFTCIRHCQCHCPECSHQRLLTRCSQNGSA